MLLFAPQSAMEGAGRPKQQQAHFCSLGVKRRLGQRNNPLLWRGESHRMVWIGKDLKAGCARGGSKTKPLSSAVKPQLGRHSTVCVSEMAGDRCRPCLERHPAPTPFSQPEVLPWAESD